MDPIATSKITISRVKKVNYCRARPSRAKANQEPEAFNEMLFADDQSFANEDEKKKHTNSLNTTCDEYDKKISISQTETMKVSRTPSKHNININDSQLQQVTEFKCFGSIFTEGGRFNREVKTRVQKANNVSYQLAQLLKHPNILIEAKAKLINSIFIPTLTYQCQTWSLIKSLEIKITTCEMRCLRRAVNKTRRDMIRNEHIREMVEQHQPTTTYNNRESSGLDIWHAWPPTNWPSRHTIPRWQASKREGNQEKLGLQVSKRHSRHTTSPLSRYSGLLLIVSFIFPRHTQVQAHG